MGPKADGESGKNIEMENKVKDVIQTSIDSILFFSAQLLIFFSDHDVTVSQAFE